MEKLITYTSKVAMALLTLAMVFTVQTARASYGWYSGSMTIGGQNFNFIDANGNCLWSTNGDNPTDLGILTNMTITSIAFNVWDDSNDRAGANMYFRIWDGGSTQVGSNQDLWLRNATSTGGHDFSISWTGTEDLAEAVGLTLIPGKTYYIDMWAKTYNGVDSNGDEWYSGEKLDDYGNMSNYHAKLVYAPTTCDVTVNLANGAYWATFYCNGANYQAPEGTEVFAVSLSGTTLTMLPIADRIVKSGEGVVLKQATASSDATTTITLTKTDSESASSYDNNSLEGTTDVKTPGDNNYYVLSNGANGVGFYKLSNEGSIGVNKAYLTYSTGAREFFGFDEATGINTTLKDKEETLNENCHDLQGRRVAQPTKGLYIVNGKKVIMK